MRLRIQFVVAWFVVGALASYSAETNVLDFSKTDFSKIDARCRVLQRQADVLIKVGSYGELSFERRPPFEKEPDSIGQLLRVEKKWAGQKISLSQLGTYLSESLQRNLNLIVVLIPGQMVLAPGKISPDELPARVYRYATNSGAKYVSFQTDPHGWFVPLDPTGKTNTMIMAQQILGSSGADQRKQ